MFLSMHAMTGVDPMTISRFPIHETSFKKYTPTVYSLIISPWSIKSLDPISLPKSFSVAHIRRCHRAEATNPALWVPLCPWRGLNLVITRLPCSAHILGFLVQTMKYQAPSYPFVRTVGISFELAWHAVVAYSPKHSSRFHLGDIAFHLTWSEIILNNLGGPHSARETKASGATLRCPWGREASAPSHDSSSSFRLCSQPASYQTC